jgi:arylsulfatase A-like enzyme
MRLDAYDRSIRYLDSLLEKLFDRLRDRGLLEDTFVIVMADHGESFGQHPYLSQVRARRPFFEHSVYVWEETQRVPLIIHDPGRHRAAERIATAASTIDVVPTVVGRLGLDARDFGVGPLPGIDLLAGPPEREPRRVYYLTFGRGRPGVLQDVLMDFPRFIGFREGDLKFFVNRERFKHADQGRCFLYDLARDPDEHHNLCDGDVDRARVRRFRHELVSWYNATIEPRGARSPARRGGRR